MKLEKNEIRVAIFILLPLVILLVFVVLKLGYSFATSTIDVYMKVDNISSIKNGTQVKIKGYTVGRVVDIIPVYKPTLHFLALLRIKKEIDMYEDCSAVIMNQNIIGDTVIEIRNPVKKEALLRPGAVIEGVEYVSLETIVQDVHALLATLTNTVAVIQDISLESKGNIRNLVANLSKSVETISSVLQDSQKDILAIMASFRETAKTMNEISIELKKHPVKFLFKGEK
ncbi:MAG TPA: MlaD family protein [Spirochaetota bacterium]|nr:MlaD family protein [Spirochaetota bacterium]HOJ29597.1 MlaD family protein [Spirochaetota bacterium]HOM10798.1 MlaD family protein [Spirochaetota bacterium]HPP50630.1 MlaD family protein [Spirochaetota bacterium]